MPTFHKRIRSFTMRQRFTLLLTCSIRNRRWCRAWLARCSSRVSSSPRGFLGRHEDLHLRERERQEAQVLQEPASRRQGIRRGIHNGLLMGAAAIGVAQEEDEKQSVDQQDIFHRGLFFLAALTCGLCSRVLGADDAPFRAVMGTRGESGAGSSSRGATTVAASASETPSRCARAANERVGHHRGCAGPPAARATGRESTDSLCSGPCRTSVPGPLGGRRSSDT
jgi:hypothetical protein